LRSPTDISDALTLGLAITFTSALASVAREAALSQRESPTRMRSRYKRLMSDCRADNARTSGPQKQAPDQPVERSYVSDSEGVAYL